MLVVLSLFLLLGSLDDESDIPRHERARDDSFLSLLLPPLPPPLISFTLSASLSLSSRPESMISSLRDRSR